jgi:metacaspase-1
MSTMTPYGRSLHIGVNEVDASHYVNYTGRLEGAENDAVFMAEVARARGFSDIRILLGKQATTEVVLRDVLDAAATLPAGSLFLLTFAGHGIQTRNKDRSPDDPENYDQNWCLYDRPLLDDELRRSCWPKFKSDTRVLVVIDSCHSGSSTQPRKLNGNGFLGSRELPLEVVLDIYEEHATEYRQILDALPAPLTINAMVLSLAACQDQERAADGPHGAFTAAIKEVWNHGSFAGTHKELMKKVKNLVTGRYPAQHPATCCEPIPSMFDSRAFTI